MKVISCIVMYNLKSSFHVMAFSVQFLQRKRMVNTKMGSIEYLVDKSPLDGKIDLINKFSQG